MDGLLKRYEVDLRQVPEAERIKIAEYLDAASYVGLDLTKVRDVYEFLLDEDIDPKAIVCHKDAILRVLS